MVAALRVAMDTPSPSSSIGDEFNGEGLLLGGGGGGGYYWRVFMHLNILYLHT